MFRKTYDFVKKHKKKALLAGAVYGGVYAYNNNDVVRIVVDGSCSWAWKKLSDFLPAARASNLEEPNQPHANHLRSGRSFGDSGGNCQPETPDGFVKDESVVATTLQLLEEALRLIDQLLNVDALRQKISQNPANKLELWEDMKILAWSRCFVAIYCVCHLVVYIKVQTGVASRLMYSQGAETTEKLHWKLGIISRHMQCTEYPIREGLGQLVKIVKNVVQKPVAPRQLQDALTLADIKQVVYEVRKLMEAGSSMNGFVHPRNYHLEFVVPAGQLDRSIEREPITQSPDDRILLAMTEDANRALESVDCNMVLNCCLEKCFTRLFSEVDSLLRDRTPPAAGSFAPNSQPFSATAKIPHVALLPALDRMSHIYASPLDAAPLVKDLVGLSYFAPFVASIVHQSLQRDSLACEESL
ncbi:putative Peroxisomal biogenesis factor 3 [Hypsibius exemplaris]|uniref:Peroxisomal biogenesis factor 3 n=1 Tax=Hypsibius exemplaris TaxID=2072580 RepID=A0A1W0WYW8_HYPEX|nr:putative Peroxisomal biogenesis factor 3 [Hypsibius exemplaris]